MASILFPPIAVVGLSGIFPKASGGADFWHNILNRVDATSHVPPDRWAGPLDWVYNSTFSPDMAYSRRACLVDDFKFNPTDLNLNSDLLNALDPLHQWVLQAGRDALLDGRCIESDRRRIGLILAAIALPTDLSSDISRRLLALSLFEKDFNAVAFPSVSLGESLCARVVGSPAAVASHALGLGGVNYTLDAACASSLYAIKLACDELHSGRADAMLAGGVSRPDCLYTQIGFSQLRALSPSGRCAPFDRSADGLVVGEGAGIVVLKRLQDAIDQNDRIYGVIRGIGLSNDMRGNLLAPETAGQVRAMQMAYAQAGWHPHWVDHIECHGAGTPVGDATELNSLRMLWGDAEWDTGQCAIGSIKSMIGHLLTGAGAAGMIKTLLALHHKTLPPSLKFDRAPEASPLTESPFRVQADAQPWPQRDMDTPRRAAVSAFGFGGINAHVLVEGWSEKPPAATKTAPIEIRPQLKKTTENSAAIAIVGMDVTLGCLNSVKDFREALFNGRSTLSEARKDFGCSGGFIESLPIEIGEFQIPPGEVPDILPQQLLMLKKAAGALMDAGLPLRELRERMGAIIGIGFDYEATNFHLRWSLPELVSQWQSKSGRQTDQNALNQWLAAVKDDCGPPLTATRTLGALGGIVASRIAREFRFGGPSFVVSSEEASGLRAMEIAMGMLRRGEMEAMLVGAVDMNCDQRNLATLRTRLNISKSGQVRPFDEAADGILPGEGAVALVLKRLDDAVTANDRIYAIVEGTGSSGGRADDRFCPDVSVYIDSLNQALDVAGVSSQQIDFVEAHGSGIPAQDRVEAQALQAVFDEESPDHGRDAAVAIGALKPIVGHTGAVSGLSSLAKAALTLYHQIIPPLAGYEKPAWDQWHQGLFHMPAKAGYWARNRIDGPRRACVATMTSDGNCMHAVLAQAPSQSSPSTTERKRHLSLQRPMGALPFGLFVVRGNDAAHLLDQLNQLESQLQALPESSESAIEDLARAWHSQSRDNTESVQRLAIVARSMERLETYLDVARQAVTTGAASHMNGPGGVCYFPELNCANRGMAFIYPGSGNHYVGMGRTLGVYWPEVLQEMNAATDRFKAQLLPQWYDPHRIDWSPGWRQQAYDNLVADPLRTIFGQVLFGGQMTGLIKQFGIQPDAVIGYSLGESAGLFAMGAWPDRGAMLERLETSDLFKTRLAGPCDSAREVWKIPADKPVVWRVAAVNRPKKIVDDAIANMQAVYRLIVNTPGQCVIGGLQSNVEEAITAMQCDAVYLDGVVTVHCEAARPAARDYKDLHRFPTTPVKGVRFYSCAFEKAYELTSEAAAESITRQALEGFDFPKTIQQAYTDGVRTFIEIGPHCSCTRMIDQILADQPHLAVAANLRSEEEPLTFLKCLGTLAAAGVDIDLDKLYAVNAGGVTQPVRENPPRIIDVPAHSRLLPLRNALPVVESETFLSGENPSPSPPARTETRPEKFDASPDIALNPTSHPLPEFEAMISRLNENVETTARAHDKFLELSRQLTAQFGEAFDLQNRLLANLQVEGIDPASGVAEQPKTVSSKHNVTPAVAFNREQCMAFAIGSVGEMLGPEFSIVDTFKARVRLPDEPLMLVDRIIEVDGEMLSLGPGRVVTEHDVLADAWYLDGERAPVCISVEAGQADLFLCAYLGIDHQVQGERTYRLLDAKIQFHRGLPRPGETIRYDIHIDKFVRHEETYLFFFRFEGHIGGEHLITMTNGCAGFFTDAEVRNSGGIILTEEDKAPGATIDGTPYEPLVQMADETYDDSRLDALRHGAAGACFGVEFDGIRLPRALCLPGERMRLIHRIVALQPWGGRFGKGYIRAEADIHPDDWFLTCHFVDDMVMPGTLMYECCAHTLRVLLLRQGWITDIADVAYEPVRGIDCRLKCRGPVTPGTRKVHYAVEIKEVGYHPEPYVIADAHMYADGHYIVFFKDMSMQMTGVTQQDILDFWNRRKQVTADSQPGATATGSGDALFDREQILAFAVGNPSDAFGQPYAIFDSDRKIARLPGPPYFFMDRVTAVQPQPWVLAPDGWVEAQYDVPHDGWYFEADRSGVMPFCILLEIALQPCGWLAAYAGSALRSQNDLKFRNLGGKAVVHANLKPLNHTLTMRTRMTKVSEAADMIIEHFDFEVLNQGLAVYTGSTYFGFFTSDALAQQVGLREPAYIPSEQDLQHTVNSAYGVEPPLTPDASTAGATFSARGLQMPAKSLCMIDGIDIYNPDGGPHGLGFIRGYKTVDPDEWFFKAHFYQDPVCPGSLGVESFLQLIKHAAVQRWPQLETSHRFEMVRGHEHQWSYRGQVIPANKKVTVDAVITRVEDKAEPTLTADGWLSVDGICIYKMTGYAMKLVRI